MRLGENLINADPTTIINLLAVLKPSRPSRRENVPHSRIVPRRVHFIFKLFINILQYENASLCTVGRARAAPVNTPVIVTIDAEPMEKLTPVFDQQQEALSHDDNLVSDFNVQVRDSIFNILELKLKHAVARCFGHGG